MGEEKLVTKTVSWPDTEVAGDLAKLRESVPLTHCITNVVVTNFTANVVLAVGASPAMVLAAEETGDFARVAQGLLINVGTVTRVDEEAMINAAAAAYDAGTPWVLDPVASGALEYRTKVIRELLKYKPSVIRGNASEILATAGVEGNAKGADSTAASIEALAPARKLAAETGAVIAVSGEVDYITDGKTVVSVPGGHEIMTKVTGTGCSLGAVIAAFLPATGNPLRAATAASVIYAAAGEHAAKTASGTGSFAVAFLDQLSTIGIKY